MTRHHAFGPLLLVVLGLAGAAPAASDETVVIATGVPGRTYHDVYGVNLARLLPAFKTSLRATHGSGENIELLASRQADIAFAQLDVYRQRLREDRQRFGSVAVVGKLTDECLFVAFRKNGKVVDAAGLEQPAGDAKPTLAVGEADGGTYETWRIVSQLEPAYGAVATRFTAGTLAINHLAAGMLDAVAWVTNPANADHKLLRATLADPALSIFGIADASLVSPETYESRELKIPGVGSIRTICTSTMIFSGPGTPKRVVDGVSDVLSLQRDELLAEH